MITATVTQFHSSVANDNKQTKPRRTLNQPHMLANVSVGCAADGITKLPVYTAG